MVSIVCLSAVKVNWKFSPHFGGFFSGIVNLIEEISNRWSEILLIDHIKTNHHVSVLGGFKTCVKLRLDMVSSYNFQAACDNFHLEQREPILDLLLNLCKNRELSFEGKRAIFIKDHAENVFPFNHSHHFFDQVFSHSVQDHLEKHVVVVQLHGHHELRLEVRPNHVVFLRPDSIVQSDGVSHMLVKLG